MNTLYGKQARFPLRMTPEGVPPGASGTIFDVEQLPALTSPGPKVRIQIGDYKSAWIFPGQLEIIASDDKEVPRVPMEIFTVQFTNGIELRSATVLQPDIIFAAMEAQRWAPKAFREPWNQVEDRSKWKIVVISQGGQRHEEPAQG